METMAEQEIKKEALKRLKEVVPKISTKCEFIKQQWLNATEDDLEIVTIPQVEGISKFSFRADIYYRAKYRDGTYGQIYKERPFFFNNYDVGYLKTLWIIPKGTSGWKKTILEISWRMRNAKCGCIEEDEINTYNTIGQFPFGIKNKLEKYVEQTYRSANETYFYNNPSEITDIHFSQFQILSKAEIPEMLQDNPIALRIKDKKGCEYKMCIGWYDNFGGDPLRSINEQTLKEMEICNMDGRYRRLKRSLFGWKIVEY